MADFSQPAAEPVYDAADDRMRRLLRCAVLALLAAPALAAPDADTLLLDDLEERIRRLNTGELRFLPAAPDRPVHHHLTRVEITPEALESGWGVLHKCHVRWAAGFHNVTFSSAPSPTIANGDDWIIARRVVSDPQRVSCMDCAFVCPQKAREPFPYENRLGSAKVSPL